MKKLTNKQKEEIDLMVNERMEYLEYCINIPFREIISDLGIKNDEALVFAREIFFRG